MYAVMLAAVVTRLPLLSAANVTCGYIGAYTLHTWEKRDACEIATDRNVQGDPFLECLNSAPRCVENSNFLDAFLETPAYWSARVSGGAPSRV